MKGIVVKSTGSWYTVRLEEGEKVEARIKGKFRLKGIKSTNPIAVGDQVTIEKEEGGDYLIVDIANRKNYIVRKSVNLSKRSHIIASNIDQVILTITIGQPTTYTGFIDRFLVTAEAYHIPTVIVFNKIDIYSNHEKEQLDYLRAWYEKIGYHCLAVSAKERLNISELETVMRGKVSVISGHSGVGKSTLINVIEPTLDLKTETISDVHKLGKHTTTFAEMLELSFGGFIIDTPGIKSFGLVDFEKMELSHYFLEMREQLKGCQFNNCLHINEPNCAIIEGVKTKEIAEFRYRNYLSMYNDDDDETYRSKGY